MSGTTSGYHVFLEPEGPLRDELQRIIAVLAERYRGPFFPPHITLAGPFQGTESDVREQVASLASSMSPFSVTLGSLAGEDTFFRAFYLSINDELQLTQVREQVVKQLGLVETTYVPHLSLFYGDIEDATREEMCRELQYPIGTTLQVHHLALYRTEGAPEAWKQITQFPLSRP